MKLSAIAEKIRCIALLFEIAALGLVALLAQKKGGTSGLAARAGRPVTQTTSSFGGGISASSSTGIYTP